MRERDLCLKRWLPIFLIVLGMSAIALAIGAHLFKLGGRSGLGGKQALAMVTGFTVLMAGALLAAPPGQRFIVDLLAPSAQSKRPVSWLGLAVWFGLVTGFIEVYIFMFRELVEGELIYRSQDFVWTIPLAEASLFIIAGLALSGAARLWYRLSSIQYTIFVFLFLSFFGLLLRFPGLHILASLVAAAGVAVQSTLFTVHHQDIFYLIVRRTVPVLMAVVGVLWIGVTIWFALPEWFAYLTWSRIP